MENSDIVGRLRGLDRNHYRTQLLDEAAAEIERLRAVVVRAKDALLDGQSTQWVHDLLVAALTVDTPRQSRG